MSSRWKDVCRPEAVSSFSALALCETIPLATSASPIDRYFMAVRSLVIIAGQVFTAPEDSPLHGSSREMGRILLLGLVSETERYFRDTLAAIILICPKCRDFVSGETVTLADAIEYESDMIFSGLFKDVSFASDHNVREQTKRITGYKIKVNSSLGQCLAGYKKLCCLRHAAVHAAGKLGSMNLTELGADPRRAQYVSVGYPEFDAAAGLCHSLVRSYNRALHEHIVDGWISEALLKGVWQEDKHLFSPLFKLFSSANDDYGPKTPYGAYRSLLPAIQRRLAALTTEAS